MRAIVLAIAVACAATVPARADDVEARALQHLERGVAAYRKGEFKVAHHELQAAHELVPDRANPYRWLALTEIQLGDCASALPNIDAFLSRVPPDDGRVAEMTRWRELCSRTGTLRVTSTPSGVNLRLDGAIVGTSPFRSLSLRSGRHELVAEHPGHRTARRTIEVAAGSELAVHLTLPRAERGVTSRGWFWPAVAGVGLVVAGGIVLAATRDDDPTLLPPIQCDDAGCR